MVGKKRRKRKHGDEEGGYGRVVENTTRGNLAALGILLPTRFRRARLEVFIRAVIVLFGGLPLAFQSGVKEGWVGTNLVLLPRFAPVPCFFGPGHGVYGTVCWQ